MGTAEKLYSYFILRRGSDFEIINISRYQMPTVKIITNLDSKILVFMFVL